MIKQTVIKIAKPIPSKFMEKISAHVAGFIVFDTLQSKNLIHFFHQSVYLTAKLR